MQYPDGQTAKLGDRVLLWNDAEAVVVCSLDTREYSEEYPEEEWAYLERGVLVFSEVAGLMHYEVPEPTFRLLGRADTAK